MTTQTHVKGLADIQKFLDTLPAKIEANIVRGALRAGAKVILEDAKARAPVGPPSAEGRKKYGAYAGALRDSIRVSTGLRKGTASATVKAGGKTKKTGKAVFYAHMIEFGTKAHNIPARIGGWLSFGGTFMRNAPHPGTGPRPFMRPALDSNAIAAVNAAAAYMRNRLATKHGLDVPEPIADGDE